jgi:predicted nucleic-acid-binding Zn-ribbon protein
MPFSVEQQNKVLEVIKVKMERGICPGCGHTGWTLQDGLVYLTLQPSAGGALRSDGPSLPSIALVCKTCGNTQLFNAFVVGVADVLGVTTGPKEKEGV